jgi:hypothetical protein
MSEINGHDQLISHESAINNLEHRLNNLGAALMLVLGSACPHCKSTLRPLRMGGNTWGIETFHEAACPEDNKAAAEPPNEDDSNTQE